MQKRNNALVLLAAVFLTFLCTLAMQWARQVQPMDPMVFTGINGHIRLFFDLPIWFLLFLSGIAVGFSAANVAGWTTLSKGWPIVLLFFSGVHYAAASFWGELFTGDRSEIAIGLGPYVALIVTIIALPVALSYTPSNA
ncbi:MAG: hypothetical protein PHQ12_05495 [Chthoniobacteraceae bacterium]|nr:hypothetical protein [Chthoniobacteraceae bacterium]